VKAKNSHASQKRKDMEDRCTNDLVQLENIDSFWIRMRREMVLDLLEGKRVLDIGCGTGFITNAAAKRGYSVVGIDMEKKGIEIAKKKANKKTKYYVGDFLNFKFKENNFDSIILTDVLEHVKDDRSLLRGVFRTLKKGGALILTVPALQSLFGYHDTKLGHYRRYSKKELDDKLKDIGFAIETIRYWNTVSLPVAFLFSKILQREYPQPRSRANRLLTAYFNTIEKNINMPIGLSLVVKARKP